MECHVNSFILILVSFFLCCGKNLHPSLLFSEWDRESSFQGRSVGLVLSSFKQLVCIARQIYFDSLFKHDF